MPQMHTVFHVLTLYEIMLLTKSMVNPGQIAQIMITPFQLSCTGHKMKRSEVNWLHYSVRLSSKVDQARVKLTRFQLYLQVCIIIIAHFRPLIVAVMCILSTVFVVIKHKDMHTN